MDLFVDSTKELCTQNNRTTSNNKFILKRTQELEGKITSFNCPRRYYISASLPLSSNVSTEETVLFPSVSLSRRIFTSRHVICMN